MLVDDANRIAAAIAERAGQDVGARVHFEQKTPQSVPFGAGRPLFISYFVKIEDATRVAILGLDEAQAVLDQMEPGWDAERIFEAVRGQNVEVAAREG